MIDDPLYDFIVSVVIGVGCALFAYYGMTKSVVLRFVAPVALGVGCAVLAYYANHPWMTPFMYILAGMWAEDFRLNLLARRS